MVGALVLFSFFDLFLSVVYAMHADRGRQAGRRTGWMDEWMNKDLGVHGKGEVGVVGTV